jgi:hypothetical protein
MKNDITDTRFALERKKEEKHMEGTWKEKVYFHLRRREFALALNIIILF